MVGPPAPAALAVGLAFAGWYVVVFFASLWVADRAERRRREYRYRPSDFEEGNEWWRWWARGGPDERD